MGFRVERGQRVRHEKIFTDPRAHLDDAGGRERLGTKRKGGEEEEKEWFHGKY